MYQDEYKLGEFKSRFLIKVGLKSLDSPDMTHRPFDLVMNKGKNRKKQKKALFFIIPEI